MVASHDVMAPNLMMSWPHGPRNVQHWSSAGGASGRGPLAALCDSMGYASWARRSRGGCVHRRRGFLSLVRVLQSLWPYE
jgi:hypothetical protein